MKNTMKGWRYNIHFLLLIPCLVLIFFFLIYPLIYQLTISFYSTTLYSQGKFVGLNNYISLFQNSTFRDSIMVTLYFVVVSTSIELLWGMGLALALNRVTKGLRLLRGVVIVPLMLTPVAVGSIWNLMYFPEGGPINLIFDFLGMRGQIWLANTSTALPALILVELWQYTPFTVLILLAGLQALPKEVYEAAIVDGASRWQLFKYVTLPLLAPLITLATIFNVMRQFKTFDIVYTVSKGGPGHATNLISYHIYQTAYRFYKIGEAAALSFLLLAIVLLLSNIFMKYVRRFY